MTFIAGSKPQPNKKSPRRVGGGIRIPGHFRVPWAPHGTRVCVRGKCRARVVPSGATSPQRQAQSPIPPSPDYRAVFTSSATVGPEGVTGNPPEGKRVRFDDALKIAVIELTPGEIRAKREAMRMVRENYARSLSEWSQERALQKVLGKAHRTAAGATEALCSPPPSPPAASLITPPRSATPPAPRWSDEMDAEMDFSAPIFAGPLPVPTYSPTTADGASSVAAAVAAARAEPPGVAYVRGAFSAAV
eukprot:RCo003267